MGNLKAVIFDMDGVLVDSEPIHYRIEKEVFSRLGLDVPEEVHKTYLGVAGDLMFADLISRYRLDTSVEALIAMDDVIRGEQFQKVPDLKANEGVSELLQELKANGYKLAVATSSTPLVARIILERCGIAALFDAIVTTSDAGKSKPAPDVYLYAARVLGVIPSECLVFEDSPNGLKAALAAGMRCVVVQSGHSVTEGAIGVIDRFTGLTKDRLLEMVC